MSWRAQYNQHGTWHDMQFDSINVQEQPGGHVTAHGTDEVGEFTFQGTFSSKDTTVRLFKQYKGQHAIYYEGKLNRQAGEINGHWGFKAGENDGEFRMKKI